MDWISDKLYYLNSCGYRIEVLDLASYDRMILASDVNTQLYRSNIVLDPTTRSARYIMQIKIIDIIMGHACMATVELLY